MSCLGNFGISVRVEVHLTKFSESAQETKQETGVESEPKNVTMFIVKQRFPTSGPGNS